MALFPTEPTRLAPSSLWGKDEMITVSEELQVERCPACSMQYAVPKAFADRLRLGFNRGEKVEWFCPRGHSTIFGGESEVDKMRRERDRAQQRIAEVMDDLAETNRKRLLAEKKLKAQTERAVAGLCPCCHRTFQQLSRHMAAKHPEQVRAAGLKVIPFKAEAV